ncbi:hypothetical protein [Olleya namhaensis]|uniref:hypothetical protein n=1 Tax=Olleya namhaensis TaxID=1144750 RepID=UPI002493904A|nr:hypothetical protein [Olleya namhaensis]
MKRITMALICILILGCKEDPKAKKLDNNSKTETTNNTVKTAKKSTNTTSIAFLENIKNLEKDTSNNPIDSFKKEATPIAKKVINITKTNIKDALTTAKNYKHAVITVEDHTIVTLDLEDCKPSGAWGACMPKAEGYIKKGTLQYQNDYANNIIGLPDGQERLLFLF